MRAVALPHLLRLTCVWAIVWHFTTDVFHKTSNLEGQPQNINVQEHYCLLLFYYINIYWTLQSG